MQAENPRLKLFSRWWYAALAWLACSGTYAPAAINAAMKVAVWLQVFDNK